MSDNEILWQPASERIKRSAMYSFMQSQGFSNYEDLHAWSIAEPAEFWSSLCELAEIEFEAPPTAILSRPGNVMDAGWFTGARLNFAKHLLRHDGESSALIFCGEQGRRSVVSHAELRSAVASMSAAMRQQGIKKGDRVAAVLPNCPEAVIAMLATASIGAIWSSCSPDFGVQGIVDRFGQIEPKLLIGTNGYWYNGKLCDVRETLREVCDAIPTVERVVVVPFVKDLESEIGNGKATEWQHFQIGNAPLRFAAVEFDHPLYVMFTSGTTGVPKCIVHGHGGTLLQQSKEHVLHTDVRSDDVLFYFTTCGWMMWNWLVAGLGTGATVLLFDGAPFAEDGCILWRIAEQEKITIFGTSAKFIAAQEKAGLRPKDTNNLSAIRTVLSTGSPLAPQNFDYVYAAIGEDIHLASISGGTDILSCFVLGNPILPVRRGELQSKGLGMATEIYNDRGESVVGERGELVCTRPFPSTPIGFWDDDDGARYRNAYFERFEGIWAHGDFAEIRDSGGLIIHGRSDAVLNPGGVRIGTAEIYRQVEKIPDVIESIAIGQRWDEDVRVVLFVVLRDTLELDDDLRGQIRHIIRTNTTPRHVPARIVQVHDIPRTKSGKIVEVAVRAIVHDEDIKNKEALANPEALEEFRDRSELQT